MRQRNSHSVEDEYEPQTDPPMPNGAAPAFRFRLVPFDKVTLRTSAAYLVRDFIPREGLILVWGPPKSGKSFKVFDIEMHIALGWDYRDHKVKQGPVVHVACEGEQGIGGRVVAFRQRFLDAHEGDIPMHIVTARLDLIRDHAVLIQNIRAQVGDSLPVVVTLDTLNRSLVGSENSDEDMGAYIKAAEAIREAFCCAVIVIHHCGHNGERPRGHSSLLGSLECEIAVSRIEDGPITLRVMNMKDGPEGAEAVSRLEVVTVGVDEDGQDITSCVVVPTEAPTPANKAAGLSKNQQTMLTILLDAGKGGLTVDEWNERGRAAGIGTRRNADFYDIRKALQGRKAVYAFSDRWYVQK